MPSIKDRMIMTIEALLDLLGDNYGKGTECHKVINEAKLLLDEHPTRLQRDFTKWQRFVDEQEAWIIRCGDNLEGYIDHYGDPGLDKCFGDGGTAIFNADMRGYNELVVFRDKAEVRVMLQKAKAPSSI